MHVFIFKSIFWWKVWIKKTRNVEGSDKLEHLTRAFNVIGYYNFIIKIFAQFVRILQNLFLLQCNLFPV